MKRTTIGCAVMVAAALSGPASAHAQARLCSLRPYPRLHHVMRNYGQMGNWRTECGKHPRIVHRLLTTGCNQYECNYASGLAYRRWLRRFIVTHGGIPGDDLLLGA